MNKYHFITETFTHLFNTYDTSVLLQNYRPAIYFCMAAAIWDYVPEKSFGNVKAALHMLEEARNMATAIRKKGLGIYSYTRLTGEIMPAALFITHIEKSIALIKENISDIALNGNDADIIETGSDHMMMTLNL